MAYDSPEVERLGHACTYAALAVLDALAAGKDVGKISCAETLKDFVTGVEAALDDENAIESEHVLAIFGEAVVGNYAGLHQQRSKRREGDSGEPSRSPSTERGCDVMSSTEQEDSDRAKSELSDLDSVDDIDLDPREETGAGASVPRLPRGREHNPPGKRQRSGPVNAPESSPRCTKRQRASTGD